MGLRISIENRIGKVQLGANSNVPANALSMNIDGIEYYITMMIDGIENYLIM